MQVSDKDDIPIGLLSVASDSKVSENIGKSQKQANLISYQKRKHNPADSKAKKNKPVASKNEQQEVLRGSYQPQGYKPPVLVGKKKSGKSHSKSRGTSIDTLKSGRSESSNETSKSSMSGRTIFNATVIDYHKKAKTTIEQVFAQLTQADNPSYFVSPETLVTLKGIWLFISILFFAVGVYLQGKLYFITIEGWHFIGLIFYFTITIFEVQRFISGSGFILPREQEIIDALFLTTTSISVILPFYFWIFQAKLSVNYFQTDFYYLQIYQIAANHISLVFLLPEVFFTRVLIEKMFAIIPASTVILYHALVWLTYYAFTWDWPVPFYFENFFNITVDPIYLFLALASWLAAVSFGVILVYVLVDMREKLYKKRTKVISKTTENIDI